MMIITQLVSNVRKRSIIVQTNHRIAKAQRYVDLCSHFFFVVAVFIRKHLLSVHFPLQPNVMEESNNSINDDAATKDV